MKRYINLIKLLLPIPAVILSIIGYYGISDNGKQKATDYPYYVYLLLIIIGVYLLFAIISIFSTKIRKNLIYKAPLLTGTIVFFMILNLITTKTTLLPTLYFPSLDRIIGLLFEQRIFLLENLFSSLKLLITGFLWGASVGFLTGLALGYNKKVAYWLNPVTKLIGPIPTTAWIPLALSTFPTTHSANVFLIAFAVWFPVTLMTSSGIQSTNKVHFEVSSTLGASTWYKILHVAIPSAMPSIFLGVFYGTVSSFATLMAVEMNGNSSGIGWYINWQKQVMMYDGVYAGLIIIAVLCSLILTLLFKVRDRVLVWQKGVIKW
jgi:NitT/TauT family transport system permease protein